MISQQRFNRTNFTSTTVAAKVVEAMALCLADGLRHFVSNRDGKRWLSVYIVPTDRGFTFEFLALNGQEVGAQILQAMFVWPAHLEREFSTLLSELVLKVTHPYLAYCERVKRDEELALKLKVRKMYGEKLRRLEDGARRKKAIEAGVTHSFRTPSGTTLMGRYARSWFRKCFVVMTDSEFRPVEKEYKLDAEAYLYGTTQGLIA